ncbi:lysophospholipase [Arenibacter sp. BSSL-BM3]|uniref:Lysophospholipase n=1 Tax=Arenibacter arenosicollis TaxID=2762274 RepID=A0ABR7QLP3_9FLAO|nr:alpha/beta hydrolase [Arenibacter arenosicollis]MBC8768113.1 lysophospholipase [Arenibacter arenosicollis]
MDIKMLDIQYKTIPIYAWYARPKIEKGAVILVHGFGEHSSRYLEDVVPRLLKENLVVFGYDNIGHGKSGGKRGHCLTYYALIELLDIVFAKARLLNPNKPIFLYGHSMGGNLVLNHALRIKSDFTGIVASSPYLKLAFQPPKWKMTLGKAMLQIFPSITMSSGLNPQHISRIAQEVEKYIADPLVHDRVSPMYSFPIMEAGEWAINNGHKLKIPTLLLHGTGDKIIDYRGTQSFHENSNKTELQLIEGGYHELHKDVGCKGTLDLIASWLTNRMNHFYGQI